MPLCFQAKNRRKEGIILSGALMRFPPRGGLPPKAMFRVPAGYPSVRGARPTRIRRARACRIARAAYPGHPCMCHVPCPAWPGRNAGTRRSKTNCRPTPARPRVRPAAVGTSRRAAGQQRSRRAAGQRPGGQQDSVPEGSRTAAVPEQRRWRFWQGCRPLAGPRCGGSGASVGRCWGSPGLWGEAPAGVEELHAARKEGGDDAVGCDVPGEVW